MERPAASPQPIMEGEDCSEMRHTLRLIAGFGLVLLGILGLLLPIMPGWVFLIPGLIILADYFRPVKALVGWARRQAQKVGEFVDDRPRDAAGGDAGDGPAADPK